MNNKKRAYISVYNKERVVEFCRYLTEYGYELIATEGTHRVLKEAGLEVLSAHEMTGYPEFLGGKVRALHPAIYTGIISGELTETQRNELGADDICPIELVVVNLYPFKEDMESGVPFDEAASHIDAGGVALLDAAAKNFKHTVAVCDLDDYDRVLCNLAAGVVPEDERKYFMYKAFAYTASYNAMIAQYLSHRLQIPFPKTLTVTYEKEQDMRYGENPHQRAAVYHEPFLKEGSLARAKQLAGGKLTYNNINDANTAIELIKEFDCPSVVACKHCTPCSVGTGESAYDAYLKAYEADSLHFHSAIVAINGVVDARLASLMKDCTAEVIVAVGFTPEAMGMFRFKKDLILLEVPGIRSKMQFSTFDMQKIYGGLLVQSYDTTACENARCVTERRPTEREIRALSFNYKVAKHARSSAVAVGREDVTVGIGAGQPNRTLSLQVALALTRNAKGCVLASDSDLPTAECVDMCHEAGITAIIQTGSEDEEIVNRCNQYRIAMLYTDQRHFKN